MMKNSLSGPIDTYPPEIQSVCVGTFLLLLSKYSFIFIPFTDSETVMDSLQGCFLVLFVWFVLYT